MSERIQQYGSYIEVITPGMNYVVVGSDLPNIPVLQAEFNFPNKRWLIVGVAPISVGRWVTYGGTAQDLEMTGHVNPEDRIVKIVPFFKEEEPMERADLRFALKPWQCMYLERLPDNIRLFTPLPSLEAMTVKEIPGPIIG